MNHFKNLNLSPELSKAIEELGYQEPTPIQAQTLPLLLAEPTDFLGLAATGTGKTAAFAIPLLERIDPALRRVQAIVLCPTRELAMQVSEQVNLLGKYKRVRALPIYGGAGYGDQIKGLKQGMPIVVATPGRLVDHLEKGTLTLDAVKTVVLDEADEMISMGFKEDIESILELMPDDFESTWLFSATMSPEVRKVADRFLNSPKMVQVNASKMLSGTVQQIYYPVRESDKPEVLAKLIDAAEDFYGLIFCQTKSLVVDLTAEFVQRGYAVDCLHGDMDQNGRERTMKKFRERKVSILICTDVACRGLDVKDLTHVINYSIPRELDNYVHRIGRTGRNGKQGLALSLVTPSHNGLLGRIERLTQSRIERGTIPTRKEIAVKKSKQKLTALREVKDFSRASQLLDIEWIVAIEEMPKEELAARFLTLAFPELFLDRPAGQSSGDSKERAAPIAPINPVLLTGNKPRANLHKKAFKSEQRRDERFERSYGEHRDFSKKRDQRESRERPQKDFGAPRWPGPKKPSGQPLGGDRPLVKRSPRRHFE